MKRFYKEVMVGGVGPFAILLDGKPVRTPAANALDLPTRALAEAVAKEWAGQGDAIDPVSMPLTRLANTAIDGAAEREGLIAAILRFGDNDALCYRAHQPPDLALRQAEAWDPMLAWAARRFGAELKSVAGLNHAEQPPEAIAALRAAVAGHDGFALVGLHVIASITGSLVLALALADVETSAAHAFQLSRIDEDYQAEKWGIDHEAEIRATNLAHELDMAAEFLGLLRR